MGRINFLTLLLPIAFHACAQNTEFTATANLLKIGLEDEVQVSYTVKNAASLKTIQPGSTDEFVVVEGPYQSTSMTVYHNDSGRQVHTYAVTLTYVLRPKVQGKLTIAQGTAIDAAGHIYKSNPLTIEVLSGTLVKPCCKLPRPTHWISNQPKKSEFLGSGNYHTDNK